MGNFTGIPRLYPVDFIDDFYLLDGNDAYGFGVVASTSLRRYNWQTGLEDSDIIDITSPALKAPDGTALTTPRPIGIVAYDDIVFMTVHDVADSKYYLFVSDDNGESWGSSAGSNDLKAVHKIGWHPSDETHQASSSILGSGRRAIAKTNDGRYVWGEYDTGAGTEVSAWISPAGSPYSWSQLWTADGIYTHVHCTKIDPFTGNIWFGVGDGSGSAIIVWAGGATWSGKTASQVDALSGWYAVGGTAGQQVTDFVFRSDYTYSVLDYGPSTADKTLGAWRWSKDLTTAQRVHDPANSRFDEWTVDHAAGYWAVDTGTVQYWTEIIEDVATGGHVNEIRASANGLDWHRVGRYAMKDDASANQHKGVFLRDNRVYLSSARESGRANLEGTYVYDVSGDYGYYDPDGGPESIAPVYWIESTGNDSTGDGTKAFPWATIGQALTGDQVTYGARIMVGAGEFTETFITADWAANTNGSDSDQGLFVQIEGESKDVTTLKTTTTYLINLTMDDNMVFRSMTCDAKNDQFINAPNTYASKVIFYGSTLTSSESNDAILEMDYGEYRLEKCDVTFSADITVGFIHADVAAVYKASCCHFIGSAARVAQIATDSALHLYNCIMDGYTIDAVKIWGNWDNQRLAMHNCILLPADSGSDFVVSNQTGSRAMSAEVTHNVANGVTAGVSGQFNQGGSTGATDAALGTVDIANNDYSLDSDSPLIGAGVAGLSFYDRDGNLFRAKSSIGSHEGGGTVRPFVTRAEYG